MYVLAVAAPIALLPQVYQIFAYKDASGLSLTTWLLLGCSNCLWGVYGLVHKEKLVLTASCLMAILNMVVVYGIILYR